MLVISCLSLAKELALNELRYLGVLANDGFAMSAGVLLSARKPPGANSMKTLCLKSEID